MAAEGFTFAGLKQPSLVRGGAACGGGGVLIIESYSHEDTYNLGFKWGEKALPGDVICLDGDLGCGKTVFAAGFAAGLGIKTPVCSPTFTILQIYDEGRLPLYHFDVYRIEDPDEMYEVGFDEYVYGDGVTLIEWGERISDILPPETIFVSIEKDNEKGFDYRRIEINPGIT